MSVAHHSLVGCSAAHLKDGQRARVRVLLDRADHASLGNVRLANHGKVAATNQQNLI